MKSVRVDRIIDQKTATPCIFTGAKKGRKVTQSAEIRGERRKMRLEVVFGIDQFPSEDDTVTVANQVHAVTRQELNSPIGDFLGLSVV